MGPWSLRSRANAAALAALEGYQDRALGARKRRLFAGLPDTIVELGPGTGVNFRYYRPCTRVIAIEPSPHMHARLRDSAAHHGILLDLRAEHAERLSLPTASLDAVVATLVLCTVPDPAGALREVRRVLRPGGRLLLLEHVAAPPGSGGARVQALLARPWSWCAEGCDLRRDTERTVREAGFARVELERYRLRTWVLPVGWQVAGVAEA